jgi:HPt (histidine-containing phosphotransfer) domain-containing protein
LLARMRLAIEAEDAAGLRLHAHSLRSNAADFGATELTELCSQMEMIGNEGRTAGAAE